MAYLEVAGLTKSFGEGSGKVEVLRGVDMTVEKGEMCTILGPSGSGKSTLLNVIGGLDGADGGKILIDGKNLVGLDAEELSAFRRDYLGFVFQFYNLVPNLTVLENIEVGEYLSDEPLDMNEILNVLGLEELKNRFPHELSGGQQQRCAIARALIKNPKLLLCDEPTGALDSKTSKDILVLLEKVNKKYGTTMLIVTHNNSIKNMVHKVIVIKDGMIVKDYNNTTIIPAADLEEL